MKNKGAIAFAVVMAILLAGATGAIVASASMAAGERYGRAQAVTPAQAQDGFTFNFSVPTDDQGRVRLNGPINSGPYVLAEESTGQYNGRVCDIAGSVSPTSSVHPGNRVLIETNGDDLDLADVEAVANTPVPFGAENVTLASVIRVSVFLGDGDENPNFQTTSIFGTVSVTCDPIPTTVPPTDPTTTTTPSTTSPTTTPTTTPPDGSTSTTTPGTTPPPVVTTPPPDVPPPTQPPAISARRDAECVPGNYDIGSVDEDGNGRIDEDELACAAIVESGAPAEGGMV